MSKKKPAAKTTAPQPEKPRKAPSHGIAFSFEVVIELCIRVAGGRSIKDVCRDEDMPSERTVFNWHLQEGAEYDAFRESLKVAIDMRNDSWREECVQIADDANGDFVAIEVPAKTKNGKPTVRVVYAKESVSRARLRIETRQWFMARMAPKRYGDSTTLRGDPTSPVGLTPPTVSITDARTIDKVAASYGGRPGSEGPGEPAAQETGSENSREGVAQRRKKRAQGGLGASLESDARPQDDGDAEASEVRDGRDPAERALALRRARRRKARVSASSEAETGADDDSE